MAVDNPSYFSLSGETPSSPAKPTSTTATRGHGFSALFRRRSNRTALANVALECGGSTQHESRGSASGASTPSTPTEERVPMLSQNNGAGHAGCGKRRSFRYLFRSVSANTDHERTQKFLKGDPRPSDIAPPSPYLPHRSHSHSEKDRRRPGRGRRVLKSASELLSNDMIYCGLTGNAKDRNSDVDDYDNDDDDNDDTAEVFLGVNDARYYNLSSTFPTAGACRRRHSIGTFLGKETAAVATSGRQSSAGPKNQVESASAPTPTQADDVDGGGGGGGGGFCNDVRQATCGRTRRRRHRSSPNKESRSASSRDGHAEDDVIFVSSKESEASNLWINYLTACFEQISRQKGRSPYKVRHMAIEEPIAPRMEERVGSSRLQIVVVCPLLLERARTNPEHVVHLTKHLVAERVLAMMLGVHDSHINDTHKSSLVSYDQWKKFFVKDQDETFVGELLGAAIGILGSTSPPAARNDKTAFSVHPKKVKLGQNRIIVLLNDPLTPEDNVSVVVDRCGDAIEITNVKRRNPYALQFSIPERCLEVSMLVGVRISKNGCSLGVRQVKCESRLRELDQILRAHDNPLEFMCQTFGFSSTDREQLDNWMVHAFQKNIPPHFNLLSMPSGMVPIHKSHTSPEESPTLLHFAARFGLEKLAWQLLECPGGDLACDLRNASELTPADLAEQAGHTRLAHQLRGYMQMNEFTNMYSYLKVMSETTTTSRPTDHEPATDASSVITNDSNYDREDYCRPRPLSEAYSVPPIARPVTTLISTLQMMQTTPMSIGTTASNPLAANYSVVPTPTPVMPLSGFASSNGLDASLQGYMTMYPAGANAKTSMTSTTKLQPSRANTPTPSIRQEYNQSSLGAREDNYGQKISQNPVYGRSSYNNNNNNSSGSKSREPSGPQDELLEIINDFKNNVFTISEVETLVDNWRKRNDVQQSFKDKQRQLMAMREEYDRIQKRMKEEMKTPTPFDKIRKFFSKGKKDTKESASVAADSSSTGKPESLNGRLADHRPVSSLSLRSVSSSSSSGRMSTVSGCSGTSLGDSGTHSDSEDRRLQNLRDEKAGMMSYEIPPAPKPFTGRYSPAVGYSPSPSVSIARDLDLRQTQSPSRNDDNEYYIEFPPSGLPVYAFNADGSPKEPQTPISPCENATTYPDFAQNVTSDSRPSADAEAIRPTENSYANIDPSKLPAASMPTDSARAKEQAAKEHRQNDLADNVEVCPDDTPKIAKPTDTDEVDGSVSNGRGDDETATKTKHANESNVPEYMNFSVNPPAPETVKVLGAIPKKLPAPPVPPRSATSHAD